MSDDPPEGMEHPAPSPPNTPQRIIRSEELLRGESEVLIEHQGELYRLRLTGRGRLYLSK